MKKELKCIICGSIYSIHRRSNRNRNVGHRKGIHCVKCGRKTKHIELPEFWDVIKVGEVSA